MHILIKNIWLYIQCVKKNVVYYVPSHDVLSNSNVIATSEFFCSFSLIPWLSLQVLGADMLWLSGLSWDFSMCTVYG